MSAIEWTDETWNPTTGCSIVSPGCHRCYAMRMARRHDGRGIGYDGTTKQTRNGPQWTGQVNLLPERLEIPLRWRKPRRVFVDSMSDLFHEDVPDEYIADVFMVMALSPTHTFQVLTKRPARMAAWLQEHTSEDGKLTGYVRPEDGSDWIASATFPMPLPNVWLGTSVEDQQRADERIPHLLRCPAAVRFLSCEPLLSSVDLRLGHELLTDIMDAGDRDERHRGMYPFPNLEREHRTLRLDDIHWVIVGGESGPGARPMDIAWARSIVEECREAAVACFVKQLGSYAILDPRYDRTISGWTRKLRDPKGGDPSEWPADLRVREFPKVNP